MTVSASEEGPLLQRQSADLPPVQKISTAMQRTLARTAAPAN
jgi:hypothetical protein